MRSEIEAIEYFVKEKRAMNMRERLKQLKEPKNRRAFLMLTMLNIFTQFCGVSTIVFYMEIIVTKGRVTMIKPSTLVIIINTIGTFDFDTDNTNYYSFILFSEIDRTVSIIMHADLNSFSNI